MKPEKELFESISKSSPKNNSVRTQIDSEINRISEMVPRAESQAWLKKTRLAMLSAAECAHDGFLLDSEQKIQFRSLLKTMLINYNNLDKSSKAEILIAGIFEKNAQI